MLENFKPIQLYVENQPYGEQIPVLGQQTDIFPDRHVFHEREVRIGNHRIHISAATYKGPETSLNSDRYFAGVTPIGTQEEPSWVLDAQVADGLPGLVASHAVTRGQYIRDQLVEPFPSVHKRLAALLQNPQYNHIPIYNLTQEVLSNTHRSLVERNNKYQIEAVTSLTGVVLFIEEGEKGDKLAAIVYNIGTTRTSSLEGSGRFVPVTREHTTIKDLIAQKKLTPEGANTYKGQDNITRLIGGENGQPDLYRGHLQKGQRLFLYSDALYKAVRHARLGVIAQRSSIQDAVIMMVREGVINGSKDNLTVLGLEIQ